MISLISDASINDEYTGVLLELVICGNEKCSDSYNVPFRRVLFKELTSRTSFATDSFNFFSRRSYIFRLCFAGFLVVRHFSWLLIQRAFRLQLKPYLRFCGQVLPFVWVLRCKSLTKVIYYKRSLCLTMWLLQTHAKKERCANVGCTGLARTWCSWHWYRLQIRSNFHQL